MGFTIYRLILASAILASMAPKTFDAAVEVQDIATGHDTQMERSYLGLVETSARWHDVWQAHKGMTGAEGLNIVDGSPMPDVNFNTTSIVAVFMGQQSNVVGLEIAELDDKGKTVQLKLNCQYLTAGQSLLTTPYALIKLTPTKKPIQVSVSFDGKTYRTLGTLKSTRKSNG
ncbi:hypothetical protein BH11ARM1_BH11ARM1_14110 [soil metagenome]